MKFKVTHWHHVVPQSRGLGDDIAKVTEATGVAQAVRWLEKRTGWHCGCPERIELLNRIFPKRKKP